jgi:acyl carrier protein
VYLITGGTGGIGCLIARELVRLGAHRLVLVSRQEELHPLLHANFEDLRRLDGAEVQVRAVDVTAFDQMELLIGELGDRLRGVVHAAGEIADGTIAAISADGYRAAAAAKVQGAWNLHQLTEKLDLQFFVLFSSAVTVLGMPGLGAYTAANEFLDALAVLRRRSGRSAMAIDWSGWKGVGMAEQVGGVRQHQWEAQGLAPLEPSQCLDVFRCLLATNPTRCSVLQADWTAWLARYAPGRVPAFYRDVTPAATGSREPQVPADESDPPCGSIRNENDIAELIVSEVGKVSSVAPHEITGRTALLSLGLDSLMAVELRNALSRTLGLKLPVTLLFDLPTLDELTAYLCKLLDIPTRAGEFQSLVAELDDLSCRQRDELLSQLNHVAN